MAIPFLSYFKKKAKVEPASAPVPSKKKSSDRLSKTVMPNALRNIPPEPASAPATVYAQTA
ncbi:MAG: hypothetical protein H0X73_05555, partial [Chthoniobacterales bacterium]|nr:hypothetical protein [Chthoniobacterales bacterium]